MYHQQINNESTNKPIEGLRVAVSGAELSPRDTTPMSQEGEHSTPSKPPRCSGSVKWFNPTKGFGFITPSDGGADIFIHQSEIQLGGFRSLAQGEPVEYELLNGEKGPKALNCTGPGGTPPKGAPRNPKQLSQNVLLPKKEIQYVSPIYMPQQLASHSQVTTQGGAYMRTLPQSPIQPQHFQTFIPQSPISSHFQLVDSPLASYYPMSPQFHFPPQNSHQIAQSPGSFNNQTHFQYPAAPLTPNNKTVQYPTSSYSTHNPSQYAADYSHLSSGINSLSLHDHHQVQEVPKLPY